MFFITGYTLLCIIVIIYLGSILILYLRRNPINYSSGGSEKSTVTHIHLGTQGDMGNQLFQLACIISAGKRSNANIILPSRIARLPIIQLFDLTQFEWKDTNIDTSYHEYDNFEHILIPHDGRIYNINGYRQSYLYFEDNASIIRDIFVPKPDILNTMKSILPTKYIALHIRKGDYMKFIHKIPLLREFRICQLSYYKCAIKELRKDHPDCPLLVCTDSPNWVTSILSELDSNAIIAPTVGSISPKFSDFCTLYLADAMIMSNSTYSFWAGYLRNNRIIIAPSPWWDPDGFIGTAIGLDSYHLHHPEWLLLDSDTGKQIREPNSTYGDRHDSDSETLNIYRLIRGLLL